MIFMKFWTRQERIWCLIRPLLGGRTLSLLHLFAFFTPNFCGWKLILATLLWSILKDQAVSNVPSYMWTREKEGGCRAHFSKFAPIYIYIEESKNQRITNIWFGLTKVPTWHGRVWQFWLCTKKKSKEEHNWKGQRNLHGSHKGQCLGSGDYCETQEFKSQKMVNYINI